jgi:hypothetical protein
MLKRWRAELVALVLGLGIGVGIALALGVGRGESEPDRVRDAATAYLQAFADDDPTALCQHISPLGRARLQFGAQSCDASAQTSIARLPKGQRDALHDPKIAVVSVSANKAAVRFAPKLSGRGDMQLVKVGGQWLVND